MSIFDKISEIIDRRNTERKELNPRAIIFENKMCADIIRKCKEFDIDTSSKEFFDMYMEMRNKLRDWWEKEEKAIDEKYLKEITEILTKAEEE